MKRKILLPLLIILPIVINAQGLVNGFQWEENEGTYNGYPLVTIAVGDKHQLNYSYSSNTLGSDIFNMNSGNWVFYENNVVVDVPTVFSVNAKGVVTGLKEGIGAMKPTGFILKASGTDRLYIKVVSSYEEQEPNNDFNSANELKGAPTSFGLSNLADIDYFKVKATAGDKITFKVKGNNASNQFYGFKWSKYSSTNQSLGSGSLSIDQSTGEREIEISSSLTSNFGTGYYYLEIFYDQSRSQYFTYDKLTVQAFLNDHPVGYEESEPTPDPVYDVKFKYDDTNKTASVIKDDVKYSGNIVIPESVIHNGETYKVTSIDWGAFQECEAMTSVTIPSSVTSIGVYAFFRCTGLTSITIPESITRIEDSTFSSCTGLTSVTIPSSVTSIGMGAFEICSGLKTVTIPNSVTSIEEYAFYGCSSLTSVISELTNPFEIKENVFPSDTYSKATLNVPAGTKAKYQSTAYWNKFTNIIETGTNNFITFADENVKRICVSNWDTNKDGQLSKEEAAAVKDLGTVFRYNQSITSFNELKYFTGLASIGQFTFDGCRGLTSVNIPESVTSIGMGAFDVCSGLKTVTIPNSVTSIEEYAFYGCSSLTSVTIPGSVTNIGSDAFWLCSGLTSVHISDLEAWCKITFNGKWSNPLAYAHHLYLDGNEITNLVIPNSVTSIDYAFYNCTGLTSVSIPESVTSIGWSAFQGCSGLTSITIPNSVTSIEQDAFESCSGLTSITIGSGVTSIGSFAFARCKELTDVFCLAKEVPSTSTNAFEDSNKNNATLHVPAASLDAYKASEPWKNFKSIVPLSNAKCDKPNIILAGSKFRFVCSTPGATFKSKLTVEEEEYDGSEVELQTRPITYTLTVTASAPGYEDSDPVTMTLTIDRSDVNCDGSVDVADIASIIDKMASSSREADEDE